MMNIETLKSIASDGESNILEFKLSTSSLKSIFETICAYLNGHGGVVLIGVKDNKEIVGQNVSDQTKLEIANYIVKIEPSVLIDVSYIPVRENKFVIKIVAKPDPASSPYTFDGKAFFRVESSTRAMPQQQYQKLLMEKSKKVDSWELGTIEKYSLDDLDQNEILKTIKEGISRGRLNLNFETINAKEALMRLKLLIDGKITNAAIALFCKDPMPYYPQCSLRVAKFNGLDKSDLIDSKLISGNAFVLLQEAESFLNRHISIKSTFIPGQMARVDIPDYPPRAIREAVVNAICHRDYTIKGGSVSLFIYTDRLEVTSHGTLPTGISIQDLKHAHESQPRNERITQIMYRRGIIESVGTGTEEMIKESLALGKPEPVYSERGNTFSVCFKRKGLIDIAGIELIEKINLREKAIINCLLEIGESSSSHILRQLGPSISERTLRRDLKHLVGLDVVKVKGRGPSTRWYLDT